MALGWISYPFLTGVQLSDVAVYLTSYPGRSASCFHQLNIHLSYFYTISFELKQLQCSSTFNFWNFQCRRLILVILHKNHLEDFPAETYQSGMKSVLDRQATNQHATAQFCARSEKLVQPLLYHSLLYLQISDVHRFANRATKNTKFYGCSVTQNLLAIII